MSRLLVIQSYDDHQAAIDHLFSILPAQPGSESELEARLIQLAIERFERDVARAITLRGANRLH
jgi:hypothetical protein